MLSRKSLVHRLLPLAVAVFFVGAGVGIVIGEAEQRTVGRRMVARRVVTTTPTANTPSATSQTTSAHVVTATPRHNYDPLVPAGAGPSFAAMASPLNGSVGLAVAPLGQGPIHAFGTARTGHAWSTSKVPVLVTLLSQYEQRNEALSSQEQSYAALALEQSDNAAIEALFAQLETLDGGLIPASNAVQHMLRRAGDQTTVINTAPNDEGFTTYGQTEWSLAGEVTFYRSLARGCLLDPQNTSYVLGLMRNVIPAQRWGAGSAEYAPDIPLAFKGGWGPDSTGHYQVRQTAIVGEENRGYVLSMLALPASGSFADGTTMLTALATWARQHLVIPNAPPSGCNGSA